MGLRVDTLTVTLGGRRAIDRLTTAFEPGKITAVLGPNGAGKSSLLRALLALVPVTGAITLDGEPVTTLDPLVRARRFGYLPQSAEIAWNVPVRAVVELGRAPHRSRFAALSPADETAIDAALALTDTARFADRLVKQLSGGERARVLLARVLAGQPDWLLIDEPLASLDPAHQIDLLDRLRGVAAAGTGIIIVVHDLNHAARVADRVLLLKDGRALASGSAQATLQPAVLEAAYGIPFDIIAAPSGIAIFPARQSFQAGGYRTPPAAL